MDLFTYIGHPRSNSYVTMEEADRYVASVSYDHSVWDALTLSGKQDCLILAASVIDRLPLKGSRVRRQVQPRRSRTGEVLYAGQEAQGLAFPRTCQSDWKSIPVEVKELQVDIAVLGIAPKYPVVTVETAGRSPKDVKSFTMSPMSVTFFTPKGSAEYGFSFDDIALTLKSLVALKLRNYLATFRGRSTRTAIDTDEQAIADYEMSGLGLLTTTSTSTTTTTTTTSSTTTTTTTTTTEP